MELIEGYIALTLGALMVFFGVYGILGLYFRASTDDEKVTDMSVAMMLVLPVIFGVVVFVLGLSILVPR